MTDSIKEYRLNISENERKEAIKTLFQNRFNIKLSDIIEIPNVKNPDFEYFEDCEKIFTAELKTLVRIRPDDKNPSGYKKIEKFWSKYEEKKISPTKVGRRIENAHSQLKQYEKPKIIILLNESMDLDYLDLKSVLTYLNDNANGNEKIMEIKKDIDLCIWIDLPNYIKKTDFEIQYLPISEAGKYLIKKYFFS